MKADYISHWQRDNQHQIEELRHEAERLNSQQSAKLEDIYNMITNFAKQLDLLKTKPDIDPFGLDHIASLDVEKQYSILKSLTFDSRPVRYNAIRKAYKRTFEWIYEKPIDHVVQPTADNFIKWLKEGDGCFWVSGKPGSGKSTMMKFVVDDPRTREALRVWSHPMPTVIASHFFWSAGTPMQKSLQGLLQTLLYDLFRQSPDLIELSCSERWAQPIQQLDHMAWQLSELQQTLQRIAHQDELLGRQCLFIDGLDEYEGDHVDFCETLQILCHSSHLKICVASRPWNAFVASFGRQSSLKFYIHELTRNDIRLYTQHRLRSHPRWKTLSVGADDNESLIKEITQRAEGVFLWVFLVTRELRDGLTEYDNFREMRRRLDSIPTELEQFFKQMLDSVDPSRHEIMASTLQIAVAAGQPCAALTYSFHDDECDDKDYALKLPVQVMDKQEITAKSTEIISRLNGRCRGLLEPDGSNEHVNFLHRTVADFLKTPEMSTYLDQKAPTGANANFSLLKAVIARIKTSKFPDRISRDNFGQYSCSSNETSIDEETIVKMVSEVLVYAGELSQIVEVNDYLGELDRCLLEMFKNGQAVCFYQNSTKDCSRFFLELIIKASLVSYLTHVLPSCPDYLAESHGALSFILQSLLKDSLSPEKRRLRVATLEFLLKHGSDPNIDASMNSTQTPYMMTVWVESLHNTFDSISEWLKPVLDSESMLSVLLRHGADPNVVCHPPQLELGRVTAWIAFTFAPAVVNVDSRHEPLYLRILNDFIAAGADIDGSFSLSLLSRELIPAPPLRSPVIHCLEICSYRTPPPESLGLLWFFGNLAQFYDTRQFHVGIYYASSYRLLAMVIAKLLCHTADASASLDYYWVVVEKAFPPEVQLQIPKHHLEELISANLRPSITPNSHLPKRGRERHKRRPPACKTLKTTNKPSSTDKLIQCNNDITHFNLTSASIMKLPVSSEPTTLDLAHSLFQDDLRSSWSSPSPRQETAQDSRPRLPSSAFLSQEPSAPSTQGPQAYAREVSTDLYAACMDLAARLRTMPWMEQQ